MTALPNLPQIGIFEEKNLNGFTTIKLYGEKY